MKAGDIVRFKTATHLVDEMEPLTATAPWKVGLLVEYHTWEKIATILHEGEMVRVAARDVQLHTRGVHESG